MDVSAQRPTAGFVDMVEWVRQEISASVHEQGDSAIDYLLDQERLRAVELVAPLYRALSRHVLNRLPDCGGPSDRAGR